MLPHPDTLVLPIKDGIRELRSAIRFEARAGTVSSHVLGTPEPTRRLARLVDGVLTRAESSVGRLLPRDRSSLGTRMDRLGASLDDGQVAVRSSDIYAVCRALLDLDPPADLTVSELRIAVDGLGWNSADRSDPVLAAVMAARRMSVLSVVRPSFPAALARRETADEAGARRNESVALTFWLAILVRRESGAEPGACLTGARWAMEAEGAEWTEHIREGRMAELADAWRNTIPYLP